MESVNRHSDPLFNASSVPEVLQLSRPTVETLNPFNARESRVARTKKRTIENTGAASGANSEHDVGQACPGAPSAPHSREARTVHVIYIYRLSVKR